MERRGSCGRCGARRATLPLPIKEGGFRRRAALQFFAGLADPETERQQIVRDPGSSASGERTLAQPSARSLRANFALATKWRHSDGDRTDQLRLTVGAEAPVTLVRKEHVAGVSVPGEVQGARRRWQARHQGARSGEILLRERGSRKL